MFGDNPIENGKWKVEKLGNLGLCKNGMNFSYEDNSFEINCLGVGDFKDNAVISNCEKLPVISLNEKPSEEYLLKDNDIVFVRSNGNKELVGRSVLIHPRVLTTFSGFCIRFRLSTDSSKLPPAEPVALIRHKWPATSCGKPLRNASHRDF